MPLHPAPAPEPTYDPGGARVGVPLAYPFRIGRRRIVRLDLVPPTLDEIETLRLLDPLGPREILAAMTELDLREVGLLRWTDVEAALEAARTLLPPDLLPTAESSVIGADAREDPVTTTEPPASGIPSERAFARIPPEPTDLDDDEATLPPAAPHRVADLLGVTLEGIERG